MMKSFNVGDKVIHSTYGLGEITRIETKHINNAPVPCYVFQAANLMLWIPIEKLHQHHLRLPTPPETFARLYAVLKSPPEKLPDDRLQRLNLLMGLLREGELETICRMVRDMTHYKRRAKLNDQERFVLARAEKTLLTEWTYSLGISMSQAYRTMTSLLEEGARDGVPAVQLKDASDTRPLRVIDSD